MQIQNDTVFNRLLVVMTFICLIRDEYLSNRPIRKNVFFFNLSNQRFKKDGRIAKSQFLAKVCKNSLIKK